MHYLEVAVIFLVRFAMLLVGWFMILRFCDRQICSGGPTPGETQE